MRWPLRNQIMGPLLAVAVASLAAVGAIHARLAANHTRERIEQQLRDVVGVLASTNFPLTEPVLRKMRDLSSAEFALSDDSGRVIAASWEGNVPQLPADDAIADSDDLALGATLSVGDREYFHTAVRLAPRNETDVSRVLHVLFPRDEYRRVWRQALLPPLAVGIAAVAAAAVAARLLAGRISRATARLGEEVQRLARGDFSPVTLPAVNDEIRDLAEAVNRTATMLAEYERQVRRAEQMRTVAQVGAGLAHELRNAATGCRMAVDLHAEACRCGEDAESLTVARRQLRLMETQLQRFMQLGRRQEHAAWRRIDLVRLLAELLPLVRPTAHHAQVELEWEPEMGDLLVDGDEDALRQAALNLVLNAVEAVQRLPLTSGALRRVAIGLRRTSNHQAELSVTDTGPGPPGELSTTLFEPFVTSKLEGGGLGLAVVRTVADAHGGSASWSRRDGCTCFRLTVPAAQEVACV
jgi:signal transduction histidine kinase